VAHGEVVLDGLGEVLIRGLDKCPQLLASEADTGEHAEAGRHPEELAPVDASEPGRGRQES
jgi:hypothetical protein